MKHKNNLLILQVISTPIGGGAEVLVRELNDKLCNYGIASEAIYFSGKGIHLHVNESELKIGIRNPFAILKLRKIFRSKIASFDKLIIHAHLTWPFFYVIFAAIGLDIKLIFTEHNTSNRRRRIYFFKYIERIFYSRYTYIVCISQGVKKSLKNWVGKKLYTRTQVIYNGAFLYRLKEKNYLPKTVRFISVGSLVKRKGFEISLATLSLLKGVEWNYTILGEGDERNRLSHLAIQLNIRDKVHFVGWSNEVEKYLHEADIQLIPSLWEGFGLVAVEGMSTGLPIVASNVDGLREVLDKDNHAVFLVDEIDNPQCWVEKIEKCISRLKESPDLLAESSRRQAEKFSLDKMICNYANLYKKIGGI
ncbi:Glycosyltransferase involved in cell wall bisynthesis [Candidatus Electronema halotolerans]